MTQSTTPEKAPETAKEKPSELGLLDGLKDKATRAYAKLKGKVSKVSEVLTGKGTPLEKLFGVVKAFLEDVEEVESAEKKAKLDTAEATTKIVQQTDTNQLVDAILAPTSTPSDVVETSAQSPAPAPVPTKPEVPSEAKGFLAVVVDTFKKLDPRKAATVAIIGDKIDPKANPDKKTLDVSEAKTASSFGLKVLLDLKQAFPDKSKFMAALNSFDSATSGGKFGLQTFKTQHVKEIFKLGTGDALVFLKPITDKLNLPVNFGSGIAAGVWSKLGGTPSGNTESLDGIYFKLKAGELSEADADAIQAKFAPLFPSTSPTDRKQFVRTIGELIRNKKFPTNQQITDLAFSLNNSDLLTLSNTLA